MHKLAQLIAERVASGLKRKSITNCAQWSEQYRVMGGSFAGKWGWRYHPWLYEMHVVEAPKQIGQKSAQMGFTEWALNKTFYTLDILGLSALYVLPSSDDASDFSASRFDRALENSQHLSRLFSDVKNVGHKRAGNASLYVRGSRSRSKLKSIDTALIVFDEVDEMVQENIPLALERQSGQAIEHKCVLKLSTPTIEDVGINVDFKQSTQEHFYFKCPSCGKLIELDLDNLVITAQDERDQNIVNSYYKCNLCNNQLLPVVSNPLDTQAVKAYKEAKADLLKHKAFGGTAHFVPTYSYAPFPGYYINQMYSCTILPSDLAHSYLKGKKDPTEETEFFNSKMGRTHAVAGAKITDDDIQQCKKDYRKGNTPKASIRTMGVDVGGVNHVWIDEWSFPSRITPGLLINDESTCSLIFETTTSGNANDFGELDKLMNEFRIDACIIDAEPERREAYKFATRHWGRILLLDWLWSQQGRQILVSSEEERTMKANRTSWLDLSQGRFRNRTINLPADISNEAMSHIKEPQRIYKKDKYGNPFGYYESAKADHFAFARVFSELALGFAISIGSSKNITDFY
jgi:hypothetical protein